MATKRHKRTFKPGDHVVLMVGCEKLHAMWGIHGVIAADGKRIECGAVSAPGAEDDPTCCPVCHEPFKGSWGMVEDTHWQERETQTATA